MSVRDDVLAALSTDAPRSREDIEDEIGSVGRQAGNALDQLRALGKCKRVADGWVRVDGLAEGEPPAPPPRSDGAHAAQAQG